VPACKSQSGVKRGGNTLYGSGITKETKSEETVAYNARLIYKYTKIEL
jgi:hypothetical protein